MKECFQFLKRLRNENGSALLISIFFIFFATTIILFLSNLYKSSYEVSRDLVEKEKMSAISSYVNLKLKEENYSNQKPIKNQYKVNDYDVSYSVLFDEEEIQCMIEIRNNRGIFYKKVYKWKGTK